MLLTCLLFRDSSNTAVFAIVAEVDEDEEKELFADGNVPVPQWEPCFCVLLQDMGKFTLHGSEQVRAARAVSLMLTSMPWQNSVSNKVLIGLSVLAVGRKVTIEN